MTKKKRGELEEDVAEILKAKMKQASMKQLAEYGFYTGAGVLTWLSLGRVMGKPFCLALTASDGYKYTLGRWRESMVELAKTGKGMSNWNIPILNVKPFFMIGEPMNALYEAISQKQWNPVTSMYSKDYERVSSPLRELIALMIPGLMYTSKELIEQVLEVG